MKSRLDYTLFCAALAFLSACTSTSQTRSERPRKNSDAMSTTAAGSAYSDYLRAHWTSDSFEKLRGSKTPLEHQRVEMMLTTLYMIADPSCSAGEILEVKQVPYKNTQREVWKVLVCNEIVEHDLMVSMDGQVVKKDEK